MARRARLGLRSGTLKAVFAITMIVAACTSTGEIREVTTPTDSESISVSAGALYRCGGGPAFLSGDLQASGDVAPDTEQVAQLLSSAATGGWLPDVGWRETSRPSHRVAYIAHETAGGFDNYFFATLKSIDGEWHVSTWGRCVPTTVVNDDRTAFWEVDGTSGSRARSVQLVATEVSCASGQPADARVEPAHVTYSAEWIAITLYVRPPGVGPPIPAAPTTATCPANPSVSINVTLDEPIAGRELVDGSSWLDLPR